jgi:hypothetical protein
MVQQHEKTLQGQALGTLQAYQLEGAVAVEGIVVVIVIVVVVLTVCNELSHNLHELSMGFHQLLHLFLRGAMRRHLLGLK